MDISASTADVMHDCDVLNPPEMPSIDITFLSKEITSFDLIGGDQYGGVSVDIGMWVGFEKVSANGDYCVWLGQPDAKVCARKCGFNANEVPDLQTIKELVEDFVDDLEDEISEVEPDLSSDLSTLLFQTAAGLLVTVIALAILWIIAGSSAGIGGILAASSVA